jgi:uncharacterized membrane protein YjjP (DUF1212 family)
MFQPPFAERAAEAELPPAGGVGFILRLGRALHTYGYPAHRLEAVLGEASRLLGLSGQFFSTPTSIFASFGEQDEQRTFLIRVEPGGTDLGRLAELDRVTADVLTGRKTPAEGAGVVEAILAAPPRYGAALRVAAFGAVSGASSSRSRPWSRPCSPRRSASASARARSRTTCWPG